METASIVVTRAGTGILDHYRQVQVVLYRVSATGQGFFWEGKFFAPPPP